MLRFPNKQIRARVIAEYVHQAGHQGVVCFSCGHASAALKAAGLYVVDISPSGSLMANQWWQPAEIARAWPHLLDATSGHLPLHLMEKIGVAFRDYLGPLPAHIEVPAGSGETVVSLAMVYPGTEFTAVYDDHNPATAWHPQAPLNPLVARLCRTMHITSDSVL